MARLVILLLAGPWLAVLSWLYWLYARRQAHGVSARFDTLMLLAAWIAAVAIAVTAYQLAEGHSGPIWKQILAAWVAYPAFAVVLFPGLVWHWRARRRATIVPRAKVRAAPPQG